MVAPPPQPAVGVLTVPSFSHCWKPSLPGAGCVTSPPHCARIHRTRICSSSGSYCRSIFCCTSRLRPYDGPRFAMLTAEVSAEIRPPLSAAPVAPGNPARDGHGPVPTAWWLGTAGDSRHSGCSPAAWQSPILPSQAAWTSGTAPYHQCQALSRLCPALPASCTAGQKWAPSPCPPEGDRAMWPWAGWAAPWPLRAGAGSCALSIPVPAAQPRQARTDLAGARCRSKLVCKAHPFARAGCQIRDRLGNTGPRAAGSGAPTPAGEPDPVGPMARHCPCQSATRAGATSAGEDGGCAGACGGDVRGTSTALPMQTGCSKPCGGLDPLCPSAMGRRVSLGCISAPARSPAPLAFGGHTEAGAHAAPPPGCGCPRQPRCLHAGWGQPSPPLGGPWDGARPGHPSGFRLGAPVTGSSQGTRHPDLSRQEENQPQAPRGSGGSSAVATPQPPWASRASPPQPRAAAGSPRREGVGFPGARGAPGRGPSRLGNKEELKLVQTALISRHSRGSPRRGGRWGGADPAPPRRHRAGTPRTPRERGAAPPPCP